MSSTPVKLRAGVRPVTARRNVKRWNTVPAVNADSDRFAPGVNVRRFRRRDERNEVELYRQRQ